MTMMSMTGFGRGHFTIGAAAFRLELRTVNHRFLDVRARLPWSDADLESRVSKGIRAKLARGHVEVSVQEEGGQGAGTLKLNEPMARELSQVLSKLSFTLSCELHTAASLIVPPKGMIFNSAAGQDTDEIWAALSPALEQALDGLLQMRAAEGGAHAQTLRKHLDEIDDAAGSIRQLAEGEPVRIQQMLDQRLERLALKHVELDAARVAQEVAMLAERCDITEELDRLASHREQLLGVFAQQGEPVGRKIEFLLQELHRELNTAGSKTHNTEISHQVVEAKAAVEKMRELALNIE